MRKISTRSHMLLAALLAAPANTAFAMQAQDQSGGGVMTTVYGTPPVDLTKGPEVEGIISARQGERVQVTTADGSNVIVAVTDTSKIKSSGGFLGLNSSKLGSGPINSAFEV